MLCGTRGFSHVDDDDGGGSWASSSSRPKPFKLKLKKKKKKSLGRSAKKANPFSANGLDKFEKLLAELEAEKKRVLLNRGSAEDTVRFRHRRSNTEEEEWVPIVIKRPQTPVLPAKKKKKRKKKKADVEVERLQEEVHEETLARELINKRSNCNWNWISTVSSVPCWAVVMVLLLLCVMFGRAFAVSWAAILWYMLPMMKRNKRSMGIEACMHA